MQVTSHDLQTLRPINGYVLIRKDEEQNLTSGGIYLPDGQEIPNLTGRVLAWDDQIDNCRVERFQRVLFHPQRAVKVYSDNKMLYMVPHQDILGTFEGTTNADRSGAK